MFDVRPRTRIAALILVTAFAGHAVPAPVSVKQISAAAKWVVHLDVDRFAVSQTCQTLTSDKKAGRAFQTQLAKYRLLLGVDPLKDLRGITLYGLENTGNRGLALLNGNLDPETTVKRLQAYPQYHSKTIGQTVLHQWRDRGTAAEMTACFYSPRVLLIGSDEGMIAEGADVLSGRRANMVGAKPVLQLPSPTEGSFLVVATRGYNGSPQEPLKALILRNTEAGTFQVAEKKGMVDATLRLTAVSSDAGFQIEQVLNGLVVASSLSDQAGGLAGLAQLSEIARQDRIVSMHLNCPAREAAAVLAAGRMGQ